MSNLCKNNNTNNINTIHEYIATITEETPNTMQEHIKMNNTAQQNEEVLMISKIYIKKLWK